MTTVLRYLAGTCRQAHRQANRCYSARSLSFEDEKLVLQYATRKIKPMTLRQLMKLGQKPLQGSQILESCLYAQNELPVRLAKRVVAFQRLPFIVGMNPYMSRVYYQYYEAFERLRSFPLVENLEQEVQFTKALLRQTQLLADVIPTIAQGFHECKKYMSTRDVTYFLDDLITARIGLRVIGEQHVELSHQYRETLQDKGSSSSSSSPKSDEDNLKNWVGSIHTNLQPKNLINQVCLYVQNVCEMHYGTSPEHIIDGFADTTTMTYIPSHIEYIVMELLKNAYRATIEHSSKTRRLFHPPIRITISKGVKYVGIRIRDEGGGIPKANLSNVFEYSWTSANEYVDPSSSSNSANGNDGSEDLGTFSIQANLDLQAGTGGPIAGLGFGLPMAKLYANYFGGSLEIMSLEGHGCDAFLKLPCIELNMDKLVV